MCPISRPVYFSQLNLTSEMSELVFIVYRLHKRGEMISVECVQSLLAGRRASEKTFQKLLVVVVAPIQSTVCWKGDRREEVDPVGDQNT